MNKTYRFKTMKACELAMVDRQKFNESVMNGFFECAPETVKGSARIFDVDQVAALTVFGQLLRLGLSPKYAGNIACEVYWRFKGAHSDFLAVSVSFGWTATPEILLMQNPNEIFMGRPAQDRRPHKRQAASYIVFDINAIREYIHDCAEIEMNNPILGDDD